MTQGVAALLLLLLLPTPGSSLPPPRSSFPLNSTQRPVFFFTLPGVRNTTTLLLGNNGSVLYVGAQDAVLSLDVSQSDVIKLKKKVEWRPSETDISTCQQKGKDPLADCPNYVRVLQQINSTHLYVCGSFAFGPRDAFIDTHNFSIVEHGSAKGRCPYCPRQRSTALVSDGELFTATTVDFMGNQPQIIRHFSKGGRPDIRQDEKTVLEAPIFVRSWLNPADRKLYLFFSEVGKEFSYVDELRIARVAQVCKDDVGGAAILQKKWTSFTKASLLCRTSKQLTFTVVQDVFPLPPAEGSNSSDTLLYGIFTSEWSAEQRSAVCVFSLQDVRAAFAGGYMTFDVGTDQWKTFLGDRSLPGQCGLEGKNNSVLSELKKTFLSSTAAQPSGGAPLIVSLEHRYSQVAATRTPVVNGKQYTVLFLLTESGFLHRVALLDRGPHVIEEIQVFVQSQQLVSLLLSPSKGVLYIGTSEGVAAVPVARCSVYTTCSQCVLARDPLCGWSRAGGVCTSWEGPADNVAQDVENADVGQECGGGTEGRMDTEVRVQVNTMVRLQCRRPSSVAALTWTSPRFARLPEELFIQSADGNLSFFATDATFGMYRCEAEEDGYTEGVASYSVQPEKGGGAQSSKSFYSELVVVSLLLAASVGVLAVTGFHLWRRTRPGLKRSSLVRPQDGSRRGTPGEGVADQ